MFRKLFGHNPPAPVGNYVTARLNCRLMPIDRGEFYQDPLDEALKAAGVGEVTGGGTMMRSPSTGIDFIDLEICLPEVTDEALDRVVAELEKLGVPRSSFLGNGRMADEDAAIRRPDCPHLRDFGSAEIISIGLDGANLDDEVYATFDMGADLELIQGYLEDAGRLQGTIEGPERTELLFIGKSFDTMKERLQPYLDTAPIAQGAVVERVD